MTAAELPSLDFIRGHIHAVSGHDECTCHGLAAYVPLLVDELARLRANAAAAERVRAGLTRAEEEIVELLVTTNLTLHEVAAKRFVSINTVKTHAKNAYRKLGVDSRRDLRALTDRAAS